MIHVCRTSTAILLAALIATPGTVLAAPLTFQGQPIANVRSVDVPLAPAPRVETSAAGQFGYGRHRRNDGAMTAILLGSVAAIAGTAVLVYANRPECSVNVENSGCGYGTKVIGGSVLAAGLVGVIIGAATWR